jgi:hypothetical protein
VCKAAKMMARKRESWERFVHMKRRMLTAAEI